MKCFEPCQRKFIPEKKIRRAEQRANVFIDFEVQAQFAMSSMTRGSVMNPGALSSRRSQDL